MNIFLCYTPYHYLLSYIFLERGDKDLIILIDQYNNLSNWDVFLRPLANVKFIKFEDAKNIIKLKMCLKSTFEMHGSEEFEAAYIFNDRAVHTWVSLCSISVKNTFYIEDGSSAYSNSRVKCSKLKWPLLKLLSMTPFIPYEYVEILGTSKSIVGGYYLYPDHVRVEHKQKPVFQYRMCERRLIKIRRFFLGFINEPLQSNKDAIALLPSGNDIFFIKKFYDSVKIISRRYGRSVLVKSHPIDKKCPDFILDDNASILPSYYPAEAALIVGRADIVIGSFTTTLYASRFIDENCSAVNIFTRKGREINKELYGFLSLIGVQQVEV